MKNRTRTPQAPQAEFLFPGGPESDDDDPPEAEAQVASRSAPQRRRPSILDKATKPTFADTPATKSANKLNWGDTSKFEPSDDFEYRGGNAGHESELHIPVQTLRDFEADTKLVLQWNTSECCGRPESKSMSNAQQAGWIAVCRGDLANRFDYLSSEASEGDPITIGGLTLMARPKAIHEKAKLAEKNRADEALTRTENMRLEGIAVSGGSHPSAIRGNKINSSREGISVPRDMDY